MPLRGVDTPSKARQAPRPQTRRWKRLLADANAQTVEAQRNRAILREHLDAADRLAERRHQLTKKIKLDPSLSFPSHDQTPQPEQQPWPIDADWNVRADALRDFIENPTEDTAHLLAPLLPAQLADLRSILVNVAANAIVAGTHFFTAEEASSIFQCACDGVSIAKAISAEARRRAALTVLVPHGDTDLWTTVVQNKKSEQIAARVLVVDAVIAYVKRDEADEAHVAEVAGDVLGDAVMDRAADVRQAGKGLWAAVQGRGKEVENAVKSKLSVDAVKRLLASAKDGKSDRLGVRKNKGPSMKELMRQRREAMRKEKQQQMKEQQQVDKMEVDVSVQCDKTTGDDTNMELPPVDTTKPVTRTRRAVRTRGKENTTP